MNTLPPIKSMRPANVRLQTANIMNFKHSSQNILKRSKTLIQSNISYFYNQQLPLLIL